MRILIILLAMMAGISLSVYAQLKVGNKTINTKKIVSAAADDYAFDFCIANDVDPYAMSNAGGEKASRISNMFSTHPDSEKRAKRMKEKAEKYTAQK